MKDLNFKHIILLVFSIYLTSCSKQLYTSLDVLRPAKVAFNTYANNLLIVNNTVPQPIEYGHTTQLINQKSARILVSADSLGLFCVSSLNEEMQLKDFFSSAKLIPESINSTDDFSTIQAINTAKVSRLCLEDDANVLLSLDKIKVNDDLNEYFDNQTNSYLASLEVKVESNWSIYYPNNAKPTNVQYVDTIYWEAESYRRNETMDQLPERSDALIDAAIMVGKKSINRFVPYWEKVDRYFYNPRNKLMRQGMDSVYVKNWTSAIHLWVSVYENTNNNWLASQAANNIAIAYEIIGDVDKAVEYAILSYNSMEKTTLINYEWLVRITNYMNELAQRKDDINLLKIQLGETN